MRFVVLILLVAFLASIGTYAILNVDERVDVTLPGADLRGMPQIYLVLASVAFGAVLKGILSLTDGIRLRVANRRLQRERDLLRDDVTVPHSPSPPAEATAQHRGPFRGGRGEPATRPAIPSAGSSSSSDDPPPYGV